MKENMYHGKPCKRGGHTLRYKSTRGCVECHVIWSKDWNLSHKESRSKSGWKYYGIPEPTRPMPDTCEMCGGLPSGHGRFHADHDKLTNKFRGWLCSRCNHGLGLLGDNINGILQAVQYLERTK